MLASLLPGRTPASLVITKDSVNGRRLIDQRFVSVLGLKIFGVKSQIIDFAHGDHDSIPSEFDRQVRAFGESGQHLIQRIKVGIVGVGGIGSIVVEQLARTGIQNLIIVDDDVIESSNISRLIGSTERDIGRNKVEVMGIRAKALGVSKVLTIAESAIQQDVLMKLRDRDIIFNCVDNDCSRAILNRFSHQYLIPVQ